LSRVGFYEVTEGARRAALKKRVAAEREREREREGGLGGRKGESEVVGKESGASLHLATNFMRLVNSRKKLTDRLIYTDLVIS